MEGKIKEGERVTEKTREKWDDVMEAKRKRQAGRGSHFKGDRKGKEGELLSREDVGKKGQKERRGGKVEGKVGEKRRKGESGKEGEEAGERKGEGEESEKRGSG